MGMDFKNVQYEIKSLFVIICHYPSVLESTNSNERKLALKLTDQARSHERLCCDFLLLTDVNE
jgi:hypothetical protein